MNLADWLSALTWKDALDFGLLFFIVYSLIRVVKGTRAVPVLVAVAGVGIVAWAVKYFDLIASASLLKYFFESVIILLIVVFQQELRRLLLYLGQRLLPQKRRQAAKSEVGELAHGLERLQKARIGALVILQGEHSVLDIATGRGTEVDAPLKGDLLVALSIPHGANTAHDGAILVEEFRITHAGVICPLTEQMLDPRFGTRHRGAIGVTEETDALALVLSEERGELRMVQNGVVSEPLKVAELEHHIEHWLAAPKGGESFKKKGEGVEGEGLEPSSASMSRAEMVHEDKSANLASATDMKPSAKEA
jgi:diadenylate cyclase